MKGFKEFITRGNLLELAVAFIMGAAFTAVVTAFTNLIMSAISAIVGGKPNFDQVTIAGVAVGPFITAVINFLLVALVVYFLIVKPINLWRSHHPKTDDTAPSEVDLLTQIRDALVAQEPGEPDTSQPRHT
ncbi:MAG: large conductance mechanosensitive channel protein MscL [Propionibacteriaceae bacterium]|jgi:large conductance mechanosensitive channel|nr:large conductance mechanosensitive channel protein MscL [Propionibacteriaceae bacterium]